MRIFAVYRLSRFSEAAFSGGGWKSVYKIHNSRRIFRRVQRYGRPVHDAANQRGVHRLLPLLRGEPGEHVHVMQYDPRRPHAERYVHDAPADLEGKNVRPGGSRLRLLYAGLWAMTSTQWNLPCRTESPTRSTFSIPPRTPTIKSVGPREFRVDRRRGGSHDHPEGFERRESGKRVALVCFPEGLI